MGLFNLKKYGQKDKIQGIKGVCRSVGGFKRKDTQRQQLAAQV